MDFNYLHQYSEETSKELCDKFFESTDLIVGKEIVMFTTCRQTNYFILRILFQEWKKEADKLQSSFFNFKSKDVQQGLLKFMEVLSFHIEIKRHDFEALLQRALEESILLAVAPDKFFESVLCDSNSHEISFDSVFQFKKYLKINGFAIDAIVEKFDNGKPIEVSLLKDFLVEVFSTKEKWYDRDVFLEEINEIHPLDVVQLLGVNNTIATPQELLASINDHHQQDQRTLNDELVSHKIESLKTAFSLNQRFAFIKKLFDGNENLFSEAITKVDKMVSYEDAVNFLLDTYSEHFKWGEEEEVVGELFEIINKRF